MSEIIVTVATETLTETTVVSEPVQHGPETPWGSETPKATKKFFASFVRALTARLEGRRVEGRTDNGGRWYPSGIENADNYTQNLRNPSRAWPWSYWKGAKTTKHTKALVCLAIAGSEVPADVARVVSDTLATLPSEVREFCVKSA